MLVLVSVSLESVTRNFLVYLPINTFSNVTEVFPLNSQWLLIFLSCYIAVFASQTQPYELERKNDSVTFTGETSKARRN
jgi:hypothetical protein